MADDDTTPQEDSSALTEKTQAHQDRLVSEGVPITEIVAENKGLKMSAAEIAERRIHVYTSHVAHGLPVECIAEDLGVSTKTVYEDLKVLRDRAANNIDGARKSPEAKLGALTDITMRLDLIFQNAMLAAASSEGGEDADTRAQVQFLRVAMEATSRKGILLDNAGCLPKSSDGQTVAGGGGFELNLKATFGLDSEEHEGKTLGPKNIRRVLDLVRLIQSGGMPALGNSGGS